MCVETYASPTLCASIHCQPRLHGFHYTHVSHIITGVDEDMDEGQDPLDSTRVHPLQYKLAQAVAAAAVEEPLDSEGAVVKVRDPARTTRCC